MNTTSSNPLSKHFRQPKVYIRLPSGGDYYEGGLMKTETGEYPVLGMTAKDELMYKTPDALLNGQATVDVIQSCVPNIVNAWNIPNIDLDVILIGIRIATFGEKLDVTFKVPGLEEERSYDLDLRILLDQLYENSYENLVTVGDCKIELRPTSYKYYTDVSLRTFEEQRIFTMLKDTSISEKDKLIQIQSSFKTLTDINLELVKNSVMSIRFGDEPSVTNREHIEEFINESDKEFFKAIIDHVESQKNKFGLKPLTVKFTEEEQKAGAPAELNIPISMDQANFFGKGS